MSVIRPRPSLKRRLGRDILMNVSFFCPQIAENRTDALIDELMRQQRSQIDPQKVLEDMERERKEMEEMFTIKAGEAEKLRENDVLSKYLEESFVWWHTLKVAFSQLGAMQSVMEEEMKREMLRRQHEQGRKDVINSALSR